MNEGQPIAPHLEHDDALERDDAAWALGCEAALPWLIDAAAAQDEGRGVRPQAGRE
ncbi:MAG: hypothetical protein QM702_25495 [Rubrivivax sp.]